MKNKLDTVNVDDLIRFSRTLDGEELQTLKRGSKFMVKVTNGGLVYIPTSTNIPRLHPRKWLARVCNEFSRTNSFRPGDYQKITANASYVLALIRIYLDR
jgi:hypothetical protein